MVVALSARLVFANGTKGIKLGAGLVFGLHGTIERVKIKVFLLSPPIVAVSTEDKARIAEGGFFNQS